jgi:hypothetical protein
MYWGMTFTTGTGDHKKGNYSQDSLPFKGFLLLPFWGYPLMEYSYFSSIEVSADQGTPF